MITPHDLLNDLRSSPTDHTCTFEAVVREGCPYVMSPGHAVTSWEPSGAGSLGQGRRLAGSAKRSRGPSVRSI
jgi:hypothetical protein